ncbi:MAG TPA: cation diffusion facilitator family transporter [Rhizobiaceae bacterium]|nr:cation diffusion facilitator family transporter [Rhizobiaceae bacterium]
MTGSARVRRLATWTIAVAAAVMAMKFVAWWLTGSVALYSDALESIVNVIAALMVWYTVRLARKPADDEHPFGHHKAEYLSAVAEGVLIVLAALMVLREATLALADPPALSEPGLGMAVNAAAALVNGVWAFLLIRTGRQDRSPALVADGHHILSDVVTSVGVLIGLGLALLTGWLVLDPLLAIVVAINILWQGWKVIGGSVQGLMDGALDADDLAAVQRVIAESASGAIEYHDLKTRSAGAARFVEFHLIVPADMTVAQSHAICDRIEAALRTEMPGLRSVIHVEPEEKAKPTAGIPLA